MLLMEMVFQRLPLRYKEHQAGCIKALLCLFDFRHGRSTRTLLVEAAGALDSEPHPAEVCESVLETEENNMLNEPVLRNLADCSEVDSEKIVPEYRHNQLFIKLLQDRSSLRVKDITNLENEDLPEEKPTESKSDKLSKRRHHIFTHLTGNSSNKDRLLKPRPMEVENERRARQLSFNNIKKKLRRGIFPSRNHLYSAKPSVNMGRGKGEDRGPSMDTETSQCANFQECNTYAEAKRHLSEMLKNSESKEMQMSVKLGMILSFPEYSVSPCSSPSKHTDGILTTNGSSHDDDDHLIQTMEYPLEMQPLTECDKPPQDLDSSLGDVEIQKETDTSHEENEKATDSSSGSFRYSINSCTNEETASQCLDDSSSLISKSPSPPASPTLSPTSRKLQDSEYAIDHMDRFSPVSVLQPLVTDNNVDISPSSSTSQPVGKEFQRIQSESSFDYIEAVLLASGLDRDNILLRWISLHDILDPMLFNEVELLSSQPHDQKLLFDCANEALEDICDGYFRSFTGVSRGMMHRDPFLGTDLIDEIWERVGASLSQNLEFCSWDYLAEQDNVGGKWIDLEPELELIYSEMEAAIFYDIMDDALISYAEGTML